MNITPDHLDRYGYDMQRYIESKFRITQNQTPDDFFIYFNEDDVTKTNLQLNKGEAKMLSFSLETELNQSAYLKKDTINYNFQNQHFTMSIHDLALEGKHNALNSMAAGIAGQILNIRKEIIRESLSDFQGVEHRLEFVLRVHGIRFINDSKATNINSTWYALESMQKPIIWIAGGIDKGNDYSLLKDLVAEKVKAIICLGKNNENIIRAFQKVADTIIETDSMNDAIKLAVHLSKRDDTVLLSPACASFDLFENFEERGQKFKEAVKSL